MYFDVRYAWSPKCSESTAPTFRCTWKCRRAVTTHMLGTYMDARDYGRSVSRCVWSRQGMGTELQNCGTDCCTMTGAFQQALFRDRAAGLWGWILRPQERKRTHTQTITNNHKHTGKPWKNNKQHQNWGSFGLLNVDNVACSCDSTHVFLLPSRLHQQLLDKWKLSSSEPSKAHRKMLGKGHSTDVIEIYREYRDEQGQHMGCGWDMFEYFAALNAYSIFFKNIM